MSGQGMDGSERSLDSYIDRIEILDIPLAYKVHHFFNNLVYHMQSYPFVQLLGLS